MSPQATKGAKTMPLPDIVKKTDKISKIAGVETPEELLTRHIETIDKSIKILISYQEELIDSREAWRNAK